MAISVMETTLPHWSAIISSCFYVAFNICVVKEKMFPISVESIATALTSIMVLQEYWLVSGILA